MVGQKSGPALAGPAAPATTALLPGALVLEKPINLFCLICGLKRPGQSQWSYRDVASILWDFNLTFRCNDIQNVLK